MRIEKKIWPIYFQRILDGDKTFELRLADWECNEGDTLVLNEWDPEIKDFRRCGKFRISNHFF